MAGHLPLSTGCSAFPRWVPPTLPLSPCFGFLIKICYSSTLQFAQAVYLAAVPMTTLRIAASR
jgi:hypothetical protein